MRKWASLLMALAILTVFSFGCAGISKDAKIKCPTCGAIFQVEEGLNEIQMKGY